MREGAKRSDRHRPCKCNPNFLYAPQMTEKWLCGDSKGRDRCDRSWAYLLWFGDASLSVLALRISSEFATETTWGNLKGWDVQGGTANTWQVGNELLNWSRVTSASFPFLARQRKVLTESVREIFAVILSFFSWSLHYGGTLIYLLRLCSGMRNVILHLQTSCTNGHRLYNE